MASRHLPVPSVASTLPVALRSAVTADSVAVAEIWHRGWRDGHLGHVPPGLLDHRQAIDFRRRVAGLLDATTVAVVDGAVVGFVAVVADEVEQLYVDAPARGTGVAGLLLRHGETVVTRAGFARAWLAVVAGNARARRFYERNGWSDAGAFDYAAQVAGGVTFPVPARRYEKPGGC